jgi:hypothetical protein
MNKEGVLMASDPRKRQKKLEKRATKRKEKKHELIRATPTGLPDQLRLAARYPVLDSYAADTIWKEGLGTVFLSREMPNGSVALAVFLVDRYCLGIKDAFARIEGRFSYQSRITEMRQKLSLTSYRPECLRKLVEGAAAYAAEIGLHAHPDYAKVKLIFGDIDATSCTETFEYGKDGKPFFIAGPHDTPARCREIMSVLERTCEPGAFDFLMPVPADMDIMPGTAPLEYLDEDDEEA